MKNLFTILIILICSINTFSQDISAKDLQNLYGTNVSEKIKEILIPLDFTKGVEEKNQMCTVEYWHYKFDKYVKISKNKCHDFKGVVSIDLFDKSVFNRMKSQFKVVGYKLVESGKKDGFNFQVYKFNTDYLTMVFDLSGGDEYYGVSLAEFPILTNKK